MTLSRRSSSSRWHADRWWPLPLAIVSVLVGSLVLFIVVFLATQAWPVLSHLGWADVLGDHAWYPLDGEFGMGSMLLATVLVSLGALLLAAPLGLGSAMFMQFVAPSGARRALQWVMGLLAGTPSVVFGLWGLTVLVPWLADSHPPGTSLLSAALVLALMILPTVALTAASALQAVPRNLHQASDALGLSLRRHVLSVALPAARAGIVGAQAPYDPNNPTQNWKQVAANQWGWHKWYHLPETCGQQRQHGCKVGRGSGKVEHKYD